MPEKRAFCVATVLNQHQIVVVGGVADYKENPKSTYLYDSKPKSST